MSIERRVTKGAAGDVAAFTTVAQAEERGVA